jgi:hypothetical protein
MVLPIIKVLLHVHPLLESVSVNEFSRRQILDKQSVTRLRNKEKAMFSMSSAPSDSKTVLCNPFLSNGTVNTSTIIGVFRGVCRVLVGEVHSDAKSV